MSVFPTPRARRPVSDGGQCRVATFILHVLVFLVSTFTCCGVHHSCQPDSGPCHASDPTGCSVTGKQFSSWAMAKSGSGWTVGGKGIFGGLPLYLENVCHQVQTRYSVPFESNIWTTNSAFILYFSRYLWVCRHFPFLRVMQKELKECCLGENTDQNWTFSHNNTHFKKKMYR